MAKNTILLILLSLVITSFSFAQTPASDAEEESDRTANISRKVDEFGRIGECDRSGRMDNFLIELQNNPQAQGYIIFYQEKNILPGQYRERAQRLYLDHLRFRKFDESRITLIESFREEEFTELWIVPPDGKVPEPTDTVEPVEIPKNATYLYDRKNLEYYYEYDGDKFLLQSVIDERRRENEEASREEEALREKEETADGDEPQAESEIPAPETTEEPEPATEAEAELEDSFEWFNSAFIDRIKDQNDSRGMIVFYAGVEIDVDKVRGHIEQAVQKFAAGSEIGSDRFMIIFGGYRPVIVAEMWVVPKDAKMPELKPDERLPEEAVTIDN